MGKSTITAVGSLVIVPELKIFNVLKSHYFILLCPTFLIECDFTTTETFCYVVLRVYPRST